MIEVRGLSKRFGPTAALGGISFSVRPGEVVGFLGPNGAGKSTTLRILTTYLMPSGGAALVEGFDVLDKPLEVRRRVGYLPENAPLYADMTVEDLLRFGARMKGIPRSGVEAAVGSVCERCGIVPRRKFAVSQLSRGYRQRTHLALALLANPPVLLLDEPTAGLDPVQTQEIRRLIRELGAERTVLLSTHLLAEVEAVSTRAILIHRGRIVGDGPFETLRRKAEPDARISFSVRARGGDPAAAVRALSGFRVESEPERSGEIVRLVVRAPGDAAAAAARLGSLAKEKGFEVCELAVRKPALEDVFLALIREGSNPEDVSNLNPQTANHKDGEGKP